MIYLLLSLFLPAVTTLKSEQELKQDHLPNCRLLSGLQPVEIHATWQIFRSKLDVMTPGRKPSINQRCHLAAKHIEDLQFQPAARLSRAT